MYKQEKLNQQNCVEGEDMLRKAAVGDRSNACKSWGTRRQIDLWEIDQRMQQPTIKGKGSLLAYDATRWNGLIPRSPSIARCLEVGFFKFPGT